MDRTETLLEIVKGVSKKKTLPNPDESLFDSGYLDSFALPDMIAEIERQFGIAVPDSDLNPQKFDSIARIDSYVSRMVVKRGT